MCMKMYPYVEVLYLFSSLSPLWVSSLSVSRRAVAVMWDLRPSELFRTEKSAPCTLRKTPSGRWWLTVSWSKGTNARYCRHLLSWGRLRLSNKAADYIFVLLYSVTTLSQLPPSLKDSRSGDVELKVLGFNPRPHLEDYVINSDMIKGYIGWQQ